MLQAPPLPPKKINSKETWGVKAVMGADLP